MIKTEACYNIWNAIVLHCIKQPASYDAIKYAFKVRPPKNFKNHRDRYVYENVAQKLNSTEEAVYYSLANIDYGITYIRQSNWEYFKQFMKIQDGVQYWYEEDLKAIKKGINKDVLKSFFLGDTYHSLPDCIMWYRQRKLNLHTLLILNKLYKNIDNIVYYDNIYENVVQYIRKSSQLLVIKNKNKLMSISQRVLSLDDILDNSQLV
jgi:hypothetical protein